MARKTLKVTIQDDRTPDADGQVTGDLSRDVGKTFLITEMPASQAERWAMKALLAVARAGIDLPVGLYEQGSMRTLAVLGLQAVTSIQFEEAEPLLDEMMKCVQIVEQKATRDLTEDDIEEVRTRLLLRRKVLELHVGFLKAGNP